MPDRWLAAFECARCGKFSDYDSSSSPARHRHPVRLREPGSES
jgi:hypothetical protein